MLFYYTTYRQNTGNKC